MSFVTFRPWVWDQTSNCAQKILSLKLSGSQWTDCECVSISVSHTALWWWEAWQVDAIQKESEWAKATPLASQWEAALRGRFDSIFTSGGSRIDPNSLVKLPNKYTSENRRKQWGEEPSPERCYSVCHPTGSSTWTFSSTQKSGAKPRDLKTKKTWGGKRSSRNTACEKNQQKMTLRLQI